MVKTFNPTRQRFWEQEELDETSGLPVMKKYFEMGMWEVEY